MSISSQWHVLYCKTKDEQRALQNLQAQGYQCYLPLIRFDKRINGKIKTAKSVLFPGYLFVYLDPTQDNFNAVRSTRGVSDFVRFGLNYAYVQDQFISQLKEKDTNHAVVCSTISGIAKVGEAVLINKGPFAGLEAIYSCEDGLERSVLLIKIINAERQVVISNHDYEVLS